MPSRQIEDMHPALQTATRAFLEECKVLGYDVLVTCTYRSHQEQADLFAQGRTKPGRIVTNARPGQSKHNNMINGKPASLAFDIVPMRNGKLVWGTSGNGIDNDPSDDDKDDLELWQRIAAVAKKHGFEWAGEWPRFREFPHFQRTV